MYNIQLPSWKHKLLLYLVYLFEVIFTPVIIVYNFIVDIGPKILAKADVPSHYKMEHYLMVDSWSYHFVYFLGFLIIP